MFGVPPEKGRIHLKNAQKHGASFAFRGIPATDFQFGHNLRVKPLPSVTLRIRKACEITRKDWRFLHSLQQSFKKSTSKGERPRVYIQCLFACGLQSLSQFQCRPDGSGSQPDSGPPQETTDEDASRTLQTVTITATKREQTLQDVPVAVSVVDSSVIEQAEIVDLNDLQSIVPSLRIGQFQSSANTNFIIRGFGNGDNNAGIEPSVGVFIDGVYRSRSAAQISDLPNIERVEVCAVRSRHCSAKRLGGGDLDCH
jgi:outer membrane receptor for monomeric catechols